MFKSLVAAGAAALAMSFAGSALAAPIYFVPDADPVGSVFTTNDNDGYDDGRGARFTAGVDQFLTNVGIYLDVTNETVSYALTDVGSNTVLRSGSGTFTTSGLEFVRFEVPSIILFTGGVYLLEFSFNGAANQNFFYNEGSSPTYAASGFFDINGTRGGDISNTVIARLELNGEGGVVPEPGAWALMILGFGAVGGLARQRRRFATVA